MQFPKLCTGDWAKSRNRAIPSILLHRQNPLESIWRNGKHDRLVGYTAICFDLDPDLPQFPSELPYDRSDSKIYRCNSPCG
jgi:hypothetical protein